MRPVRPLLRLHEPLSRGRSAAALAAASVLASGLLLAGTIAAAGPGVAGGAARPPGPGSSPILAVPTTSLETPGTTSRVSLGTQGQQLGTASTHASISADGRYVVFRTAYASASGVDLGQILLRDRVAGTTTLVAQGSIGGQIAVIVSSVSQPVISADGRWVAFVAGSPSSRTPSGTIQVWDRTTGQVSPAFGQHLGSYQDEPALSSNGHYLAFRTDGAYSSADTNGTADVYVYDRQGGTFDWVSATIPGTASQGSSAQPAISADGRYVAFASTSTALVSGVTSGVAQVYLRDRTSRTTQLVSTAPDGTPGQGASRQPSISGDGSEVAFVTSADNIESGASDMAQVVSWNASIGNVTLVSADPNGAIGNASSSSPAVSGDGRTITFASVASNLVPSDLNQVADIFIHDLVTTQTSRVSVAAGPAEASGLSAGPAIDGDGGAVAFESDATNLVGDDTNGVRDVFVRDRPGQLVLTPSPVDFGTVAVGSPAATQLVTATDTGVGPVAIQGTSIGGTNATSFAVTSDGCTGQTLFRGESCQIGVSLSATAAGAVTGILQVADTAPGAPHGVPLRALALPGTGPHIVLSPTVGPPGTVVAVTGTGFPPGQAVTFSWSVGITPTPLSPTTAAADGTFQAQVLVLPNDLLGSRTLIAAPQGSGSVPATAPFLVVQHTSVPPVAPWLQQLIPGFERPLIERH